MKNSHFFSCRVIDMSQRARLDDIIGILKKHGYVTVKYLTEELHYSTATINRDLNLLQKQKLVKRNYGGVELVESTSVPLIFRYHKMKPAKNRIGKKAAEYICDGDTVFIDASTTTQCIGQYITERKDITVITNNMALVSFLSEYNIKCICLGGTVTEIPSMLGGLETNENVRRYRADKMFFATCGIYDDGKIGSNETYHTMHSIMAENSKSIFYLADSDKVNIDTPMILFDASHVDYVISDFSFSDEVIEKYKNTKFVHV